MSTPPPGPLLTVRAAVVLLTALVVGLVAGGLGGGAVGAALLLFHSLLGR